MNKMDEEKLALVKSSMDEVPEECYVVSSGFYKGMMYAILLSIPLWLSIFGWIKIIRLLFL